MWVNFKNLCANSNDFAHDEEQRDCINILCQPAGLIFKETIFYGKNGDEKKGFLIVVENDDLPSPKICFYDKEKAEEFYEELSKSIAFSPEYAVYDVLEYGAI